MAAPDKESPFSGGVAAWQEGLGRVRDVVRQELVARQLATHLPRTVVTAPAHALDVGCGQGTQAVRLARAGYRVTGLDPSDELLDLARAAAADEPMEIRRRLSFQRGDLLALDGELSGSFDAVCCHGVLMYLPTLGQAVQALVGCARVGGLLSVLTRNQAGIAMRAGMTGDWQGAIAGFDAHRYRNRLGIEGVRADAPDQVADALRAAGAGRVAWYGVRLFTDHWTAEDRTDALATVIDVESEAGRRDPYRSVAALTHTIAIRTG